MNKPLTDVELDEIEKRVEATSKGPWIATGYLIERKQGRVEIFLAALSNSAKPGDADFIASARTDVPRLVAEVRRLRQMIANSDVSEDLEPKNATKCK